MIKMLKLNLKKLLRLMKLYPKKIQYDQYGHSAFDGSQGFGGGMDMEDIFSQFGDIFGSAFGGFGGGFSSGLGKIKDQISEFV